MATDLASVQCVFRQRVYVILAEVGFDLGAVKGFLKKHLPDQFSGFSVKIGVVYGEVDTACFKSLWSALCTIPRGDTSITDFRMRDHNFLYD